MNEEEVIERLNRYKTIKVLYGNTFAMHLEQLEQLKNDIDTVLNLLETQKAEIEKKDKEYEELTEASKELCKTVNLMKKVINEMARYIDKITEEIAREKGVEDFEFCDNKCTDKDEYIDCKDCIKEYFTKKAEKGE